jgi:hypothetical protein
MPIADTFETRFYIFYISSAALDIDRIADGARGHWGGESSTGCSTSSSRTISRATAAVTAPRTWPSYAASRSVVRANKSKRSVKTRRKSASWDTSYLLELLQLK